MVLFWNLNQKLAVMSKLHPIIENMTTIGNFMANKKILYTDFWICYFLSPLEKISNQ